jgi:hypothetical protein
MPDIAITVLSDFINRYEQRIIEYDTEECKYFYELQSIDFARISDDMANKWSY